MPEIILTTYCAKTSKEHNITFTTSLNYSAKRYQPSLAKFNFNIWITHATDPLTYFLGSRETPDTDDDQPF